jgi:hypothetical protein
MANLSQKIRSSTMDENSMKNNPLSSLLLDQVQETSRGQEILARVLKPYAYINPTSQSLFIKDESFEKLNQRQLVILLFLGRLAMANLEIAPDATLGQSEVISYFKPHGIPEGTIKVSLKNLRDDKILSKADNGKYEITFSKLIRIEKELDHD